ncbi:MAG: phage tail tape measure protein, partial [Clostridiales bacterium]|nr:phage tail tape measure protein [Clostridiales bacterium]
MVGKNITVILDMLMNTSNVNSGIGQIRQQLKTLKLPSNLQESFRKSFSELDDGVSKIQRRLNSGFKTKSDVTGLEKELKNVDNIIANIIKDYNKIGESTINKSLKLENLNEFKELQILLADINKELSAQKETTAFKKVIQDIQELNKVTKANALKQFTQAIDTGNIEEASKALEILKQRVVDPASQKIYFGNSEKQREYNQLVAQLEQSFNTLASGEIQSISERLNEVNNRLDNVKSKAFNELSKDIQTSKDFLDELQVKFRQAGAAEVSFASDTQRITTEMDKLNSQVEAFFGVSNYIQLFKRAIHAAYESVQELDKAMTETAVVTDFSVGDMWNELPRYTEAANKLGTTTLGAYQTMTLFYQQGLKTNEVFEIGTETMKMARIAGMDYTKATNLMTAALRGFNMELNETSATRINDVYSKLAAITAADTKEIAEAMTRTASIANSAGMEFETTSALLSQMIETTREAPENLGTAMKTIIARFQELKKAPSEIASEIDGEALDVNKIDTALKSIGVSLMDNVTGQFRDLDDVFLEIASKWNSLDKNTQRYIATVAAGSRQQSRFIAMMSNYERTMELVDAANNSAGASQLQFEKTTESLESKVNKLKNAVNEFVMGIANNQIIKLVVDVLTNLLTVVNNLSNAFGNSLVGGVVKLGIAIAGLKGARGILEKTIGFISKSWTGVDKNTDRVRTLGDAFLSLKAKGEKGKKGISTVTNAFQDFYNDLAKGTIVKDIDFSEIGTSLASQLNDVDSKKIQDLATQYKTSTTQVIAFNKARAYGVPAQKAAILLRDEEAAKQLLNAKLTDEETK